MRKHFLFLLCLLINATILHANEEDLLVLLPPQFGDIAHIDTQSVETIHVSVTSFADGVIHTADYKDGGVRTIISGTTSDAKREIGVQRIFRDAKEISSSKEYFLDKPDTIVHVHDKYIVSTTPNKQIITPRKK